MCTRGVWQLQRLVLRYSPHEGSSAGIRDYIATHLVPFARANPHLKVETEVASNRHPVVFGTYADGTRKEIDVKNKRAAAVARAVWDMRNVATGRVRKLNKPVVTAWPSVQGVWDPSTTFPAFTIRPAKEATPAVATTTPSGGAGAPLQ